MTGFWCSSKWMLLYCTHLCKAKDFSMFAYRGGEAGLAKANVLGDRRAIYREAASLSGTPNSEQSSPYSRVNGWLVESDWISAAPDPAYCTWWLQPYKWKREQQASLEWDTHIFHHRKWGPCILPLFTWVLRGTADLAGCLSPCTSAPTTHGFKLQSLCQEPLNIHRAEQIPHSPLSVYGPT